jgi:pyruvate kinase
MSHVSLDLESFFAPTSSPSLEAETSSSKAASRSGAPKSRNSKIVCTLGPACNSSDQIRRVLKAGARIFRFNFSHGTHESHTETVQHLRSEAFKLNVPIAIMQDLCGPKIRVSYVRGDAIETEENQRLRITTQVRLERLESAVDLATTYEPLLHDVEVGDALLINDGRVELVVEEKHYELLTCRVRRAGLITLGKGLNMPGVALSTPSITAKDWSDLEWGVIHEVDFVALSFVRHPDDLLQIHQFLDERDCSAKVISKIERPEAIERIHEIIQHSDGLMVARGDLGLETDFAEVPILQKKLIELCRYHAKPVITATQMLDSMVSQPTPTRAEVSDVANAILDGSDAIMLSNETAAGQYPVEAVQVLDRIGRSNESGLKTNSISHWTHDLSDAAALTEAAARMALRMNAKRIVVYTQSGNTARLMARYRLQIPIIAVTSSPQVQRQLVLSYGVRPFLIPEIQDMTQLLQKMNELALELQWGQHGDQLVVVSGLGGQYGYVDTLHVHRVRSIQCRE